MKLTISIIASMVCTSIILVTLALLLSLTFGVNYYDIIHSTGFCVVSFFSCILIPVVAGGECYELLEKKGL